jgi:PhnB protein
MRSMHHDGRLEDASEEHGVHERHRDVWSMTDYGADAAAVDEFHNTMTPVLTVRDAVKAVAFYQRAFGAEEIYRNSYGDGMIVAELAVGEARFRVADEIPEGGNLSPESLGGTSVRLNLMVADPDGLAARATENGAIEVAPIADQSYGLRQGRLVDPFGHHWLIGRPMAGAFGDWALTEGEGGVDHRPR